MQKIIKMIKEFFCDDVKAEDSSFSNFGKESIQAVIEEIRDEIRRGEYSVEYHRKNEAEYAIKLILNKKALEILK